MLYHIANLGFNRAQSFNVVTQVIDHEEYLWPSSRDRIPIYLDDLIRVGLSPHDPKRYNILNFFTVGLYY